MQNGSSSPDAFDEVAAARKLLQPPTFASLPDISILRSIGSNLLGCLARHPKPPVDRAFAPMFRSAYVRRRPPGRSLLASALLHIGVIACLVNLPSLPNPVPNRARADAPKHEYKIVWYVQQALLPTVSPPPVKTPQASKSKRRRTPEVHLASAVPVQVIISRPPKPDNERQTIVQPEAPSLRIPSHIEVPNLVQWSGVAVPPRPVVSEATRQLAQINVPHLTTPTVAPPPPMPEPPDVRPSARVESPNILQSNRTLVPPRPVASEASRQLAQIDVPHLPVPSVTAPPPAPPQLSEPNRNITQVPWPAPNVGPLPKPPVPEQPPSLSAAINPQAGSGALRNLIAVGVAPAPPPEQFNVPQGNRSGEFDTTPGKAKTAADQKISGGDTKKGVNDAGMQDLADRDLGGIRVPHLSIAPPATGANPAGTPGAVVARPPQPQPAAPTPPASDENIAKLIAKATRPSLLPEMTKARQPESAFFGAKRFYTVSINMPNLTSGSGSWVLRFAELNGNEVGRPEGNDLSSPVAVRKVDPRYEPSAVRDRVEGTVTLGAEILRDGTVSNIRVLSSLDPRLDSSAAAALADWQFVPARKNGAAIDLEVVVQIPFRLPAL